MSVDTVDDLHAAEDRMGTLACELRDARLALSVHSGRRDYFKVPLTDDDKAAIARALDRCQDEIAPYCRPGCGFLDDGECLGDDCCGCPCNHEEVPDDG